MKIHIDKRIELAFLYISIMGIAVRYWVLPDIRWWQQALLFIVTMIMLNAVWIFHYVFNHWLNGRFPFERSVTKRIVIQLIGSWSVVKTVLIICSMLVVHRIVPSLSESFNRLTLMALGVGIFLANVVISLGFIANQLFQRWQADQLRAAQLEKEKAQVQYDNLRNQLNPHFLFNSLSSLDNLIDDDPALARRFLQQLSRVFRYVLQHKDRELVPLETELGFIKNYVSLLQTRFDGTLSIRCQIEPDDTERLIVPVTLQILIENAIKHNVISEAQPLPVLITTDHEYLTVSNPVQRKKQIGTSNGLGLQNLTLLYQFLTPKPVEVQDADNQFRVRVPLVG
ncbi:sensor histidine kinase [Spirosoma sp. 209]|uniref:sensor histidine kinase n=1 Tax=Spirosoma sp. 209 TaxID=1955701 RepID=UPI00098D6340|nr:histidine kinase [Spirosoma sp. 209]